MGRAEAFLCCQTLLLVSLGSWLLGGRATGAVWLMAGVAWMSILVIAVERVRAWKQVRSSFRFSPENPLPSGWCWVLLAAQMGVSLANPLYDLEILPGGAALRPREAIGGLPGSMFPPRSWPPSVLLMGLLVHGWLLFSMVRSRLAIRVILGGIAINAAVLAVVGTCLNLVGVERVLGVAESIHRSFFASFRYHNHWVAFGVLGIFAALALSVGSPKQAIVSKLARRNAGPWFWGVMAGLIWLTFALVWSRMGLLVMGIISVLVVWHFWGHRPRSRQVPETSGRKSTPSLDRGGWAKRWVVIGVIAGLSLGAASLGRDSILDSFERSRKEVERIATDPEADARFYHVWRDTLPMIAERPLFGWGFGSYGLVFFLFSGDEYRQSDGTVVRSREYAHNDWLQFLSELGIIGCALLLVPPLRVLKRIRATYSMPKLTGWLMAGITLILVVAIFEYPLSNPAVLATGIILLSLGLRSWQLYATHSLKVNATNRTPQL